MSAVHRKKGGVVLILLSIAMWLLGGGSTPPITGILAGIAALGINAPLTWWRAHLPAGLRHVLAVLWPWVYAVAVANGLLLFLGSVILVWFLDVSNPDLFLGSFVFVVSVLMSILTGIAYDIENSERRQAV